jgi:hypothetical protein
MNAVADPPLVVELGIPLTGLRTRAHNESLIERVHRDGRVCHASESGTTPQRGRARLAR